jgi:6-phosphogluconolactonase
MKCSVFVDVDQLAVAFRSEMEAAAQCAITARGRFAVALTGGSSAARLYPSLAKADLDWARVQVFFGDERLVPADHSDSNLHMAWETFLKEVGAPPIQLFKVATELGQATTVASDSERTLLRVLGHPPVFDVIHLGLGLDGHVCSLFPGQVSAAEDETRWVVPVEQAPKPPPSRVSLSMRAILAAREVWFLALGKAKAGIVRDVHGDEGRRLPAGHIAHAAGSCRWFLDHEAASELNL